MPESKGQIDFSSGQKSSDDPLGGAIPVQKNVLIDASGSIHLRPGIKPWGSFGKSPNYSASTSVDGMSVWNGYLVYVTSDRQIHVQVAPNYALDLSSAADITTQLDGVGRPIFAPTRVRMVIAGGGLLQDWEGTVGTLSIRLPGNPPPASHVVKTNEQLIVNPAGLSGQMQWSDFGDGGETSWVPAVNSNAGTLTLAADPDPLSAVYQNTGEIVGFGTRSVQIIDPDPSTTTQGIPVVWTPARSWTTGTQAPYSLAQNDEEFAFFDNLKRFQMSNGRTFNSISDPALTSTLRDLQAVSDCWGFRPALGAWDLLGWNFPTEGRTFVYDTGKQTWGEWSGFSGGFFTGWMAKSHYFWPEKGIHLIGLGDGTIGQLDAATTSDMGVPIVGEIVSGFQDFGSDLTKTQISTRFFFRRGIGQSLPARPPRCQLYWRDGTGAWEGPEELDFGDPSDTQPAVEVRGLGTYRMRQWRLRMSDGVPITFVRAIETFELGEI